MESDAIQRLIETAINQTVAGGGYVYRLRGGTKFELVAAVGIEAAPAEPTGFAEVQSVLLDRFAVVEAVPLAGPNALEGIALFGRVEARAFQPAELRLLSGLAEPLTALLRADAERSALEAEARQLARQLAARDPLDQAKRLLQARFAWTEEDAYFYLRRHSRRRRIPMAWLANEVIRGLDRRPRPA